MTLVQRGERRSDAGTKHCGGELVSIISGAKGVGTTNLALNLGVLLARAGGRTVLVDAGAERACADVRLRGDLGDVLRANGDVARFLADGPGGVRLVGGAPAARRATSAHAPPRASCARALVRLRDVADFVVVDGGSGVQPTLASVALAADRVILVSTVEPTALADTYGTLKYLHQRGVPRRVDLVLSMTGRAEETARAARRLHDAALQFLGRSVRLLGQIPFDPHVSRAARRNMPVALLYPASHVSGCLKRICDEIVPAEPAAAAPSGVWSRLAGLFL
jgi:flagellar biosynthesis protein FlhG